MSRRLEIEFVTASCALIRGHGSRELVTSVRGRPPVWATRSRAWVVQPSTARDVVAAAERAGYDVTIKSSAEDPRGSLW